MRHLLSIVACAVCLAVPANGFAGEVTVDEYMKATGDDQSAYRVWLSAVEEGFGWYKAVQDKDPVYCPPSNLALTDDQVDDIFRRYVTAHPDMAEKAEYAGLTLLLALHDTFPCEADTK